MKPATERELLAYWFSGTPTAGLEFVVQRLQERSGLLLKGKFVDDAGRKCLASWFAHFHPTAVDGPDWLRRINLPEVSHVIAEWDRNPRFPRQLLECLQLELFYRRADGTVHRSRDRAADAGRVLDNPRRRRLAGALD